MYRKLYVDGCVDIVCNAVKVQSPLTLEQLCQIIQENLPGSCVPKDNLKEDARLVILDDSSFTIEYANTVPETKLLFSIAHELGHLILHFLEDDGNGKLKTKESVNIGEVEEYEANEFAAYLLMPDEQFISKCKEFSENGMISINKLAEYFHVSNYRLNIDDLLYFALQLEEKKRNLPAGSVYGIHSLAITTKIIKNLPFQLTKDQKSAYEELVNRIRSGKRLNALIQGDVGCGKTILAFLLMFVMADNGFQSVLLAPTQVLASQHYNELKEMAAQYNIDVVYIANGLKKKEREAILKSIEDGSALMIVGTHSVLSKEVKFHDLGLSITDEEHRFGVLQREEITTKAKAGMHTVTMSATPIPRSLSDVLLSTTEVFNIQSMPNGRKPIQTAICASQNTIFQFIKKEIEKGHQAYVVCPLIEDKQGVMEGILSVEQTYTEYANIFGKNAVAVLNGKMNEDETEKVIRSFKNGEIKILVSTTVVEVGVNVSNATVIVINNAERFGLASLHQLRGRVGRGNSQGYCILNSVHKNNKRLLALCKYKNGFQIAESDYALRGSGNILGTEQSGSNYYVELSMKYPDLFSELQKYAKKYMDTGEAEMIVKTYQMSIKR